MVGIVIDRLDHLVITVRDIEATLGFYERVLGMRREVFGGRRFALHFGRQKMNVHPYPSDVEIVAKDPRPGTADLCFIAGTPLDDVIAHLGAAASRSRWGRSSAPGRRARFAPSTFAIRTET